MKTIYDFSVKDADLNDVPLKNYQKKVLLIVNVNRNKLNVNSSKYKCTCNIVIFKELKHIPTANMRGKQLSIFISNKKASAASE